MKTTQEVTNELDLTRTGVSSMYDTPNINTSCIIIIFFTLFMDKTYFFILMQKVPYFIIGTFFDILNLMLKNKFKTIYKL